MHYYASFYHLPFREWKQVLRDTNGNTSGAEYVEKVTAIFTSRDLVKRKCKITLHKKHTYPLVVSAFWVP